MLRRLAQAPFFSRAMSTISPTAERAADLKAALGDITLKVNHASSEASSSKIPRLVAVSKLKPATDIAACFEAGHRHFGENYVQELVDKAAQLPADINWHFIGALQSNKAKLLAGIPNLWAIETLSSTKTATLLDKSLASTTRSAPLNVFIQINTSAEDSKSAATELAKHVLTSCANLRLKGVMTIGSFDHLHDDEAENPDFNRLVETRNVLLAHLLETLDGADAKVAELKADGLELSMGMSDDFERAIKQGSTNVRVGSSIFGTRPPKGAS